MSVVAIVGGGISGLAVAEAIERHGKLLSIPVRTVVLEAEAVPGGKIGTIREGGYVIETGPHGFLDREPKAMALVERLGLGATLIAANEVSADRFIVRDGKLRRLPTTPPAFLTSDVLPLVPRLRVALEPFIAARTGPDDESVWAFAARRLGPEAADVMVDAMVTGIYGGDPKRLSVRSAFPLLAELESRYGGLIKGQIAKLKEARRTGGEVSLGGPRGKLHSFKSGLAELIEALVARLAVERGFRVAAIQREASKLRVVAGDGRKIDADAVVITAPAEEIARLTAPFAEPESRVLAAIPYAPIAIVVQIYRREDLRDAARGFGFLVPHREGRQVLGAIFASTVFAAHAPEGRVMLRILLGGVRRAELVARSDAELAEIARAEVLAILGAKEATPVESRVLRWPRAIPQYDLGHGARVEAADAIEAKVPGLLLGGNALRGVAMTQCIAEGDRLGERVVRGLARQ